MRISKHNFGALVLSSTYLLFASLVLGMESNDSTPVTINLNQPRQTNMDEIPYLARLERAYVVTQDEAAIIGPDSREDYLTTGQLKPCQGIVVSQGGYTILFHRSAFTDLAAIKEIYDGMVKRYGISVDNPLSISVVTNRISRRQFKDMFESGYCIVDQDKLLSHVVAKLSTLFDVDKKAIDLIVFDRESAAGKRRVDTQPDYGLNIAVDRNGTISYTGIGANALTALPSFSNYIKTCDVVAGRAQLNLYDCMRLEAEQRMKKAYGRLYPDLLRTHIRLCLGVASGSECPRFGDILPKPQKPFMRSSDAPNENWPRY